MWTVQEGPSDLSLEVTLITGPNAGLSVRFENLHVM